MKIMILFICMFLFLGGCSIESKFAIDTHKIINFESGQSILYVEGKNIIDGEIVDKKNDLLKKVVPDIETAVGITDIIMKSIKSENSTYDSFQLFAVSYDKLNGIWIACYAKDIDLIHLALPSVWG